MYKITNFDTYLKVDISNITSAETLVEAIQAVFFRPDYFRSNDIWEFGNELVNLRFEDLDHLTDHILQIYPKNATRTRTALVTPPGLNEAFAKLWAATAHRLPYEVKLFTDFEVAELWINEVA